jgi:hypothetical protein
METIEQKVKKVTADDSVFESRDSYKNFKQLNEYYETLVKEGVVSKRGYCLKTIDDVSTFKYDKNLM